MDRLLAALIIPEIKAAQARLYPGILWPRPIYTPGILYCIVLYCIVLYLYIYIALLAVHTNQKRFQCERPREKRAVLRERKEELGTPVNEVDRVEGRGRLSD